jgi:hypothetical protein
MRSLLLWVALASWLSVTATLLWWFNPISAVDLAKICTTAR